MSQELEALLKLKKGELAFLSNIGSENVEKLQSMFERARENQRAQVEEAIDSGLQIVPAILRKTVRKIFGDS